MEIRVGWIISAAGTIPQVLPRRPQSHRFQPILKRPQVRQQEPRFPLRLLHTHLPQQRLPPKRSRRQTPPQGRPLTAAQHGQFPARSKPKISIPAGRESLITIPRPPIKAGNTAPANAWIFRSAPTPAADTISVISKPANGRNTRQTSRRRERTRWVCE